jgi:hypothetical protein
MKTTWLAQKTLGEAWSAQVINRQAALSSLGGRATVAVGELCRIESGQYIDEYVEGGRRTDAVRPYIRVDNVRPFVANMNPGDLALVRRDHPAVLPRSLVAGGDVLIARTGTLGKATLAVGEVVGCVISQHITRLTVRDELGGQVTPEFLCAFLNSVPGRAQLLAGGSGSTRLELTHERLSAVRVPLVATRALREVTALVRTGAERLARSGEGIRRAVGLYTAGFPGDGAGGTADRRVWLRAGQVGQRWSPRYHCLGSDDLWRHIPDGYEPVPLGSIAETVRGKGTRSADYTTSGIPFVRTTSLINGSIDPFPDHYASPETYARYQQQTREGDILLSIEGKIGQVAYLTDQDRCVFKNHIELVRPRDRSLAPGLFLALASEVGQSQMRRLTVVQATLPGLASRSRQILVPLPPQGGSRGRAGTNRPSAEARRVLSAALALRRKALQSLVSAASSVASIFSSAAGALPTT